MHGRFSIIGGHVPGLPPPKVYAYACINCILLDLSRHFLSIRLLCAGALIYYQSFVVAVTDAEPPILEPQMEPSVESQLPQQHASTSSN